MGKYTIKEINNNEYHAMDEGIIIEKFESFSKCNDFLYKYIMNQCVLRLISLGFSENQSISIIKGLENCHISGCDAGGAYTEFEQEALPDAINEIEKHILKQCLFHDAEGRN